MTQTAQNQVNMHFKKHKIIAINAIVKIVTQANVANI